MVFANPLPAADLADLLGIESANWRLGDQQEYSAVGNGEIIAADLGVRYWVADCTTKPYRHTEARGIQARFEALNGSLNSFYLYDPQGCYPAADPGGLILGTSAPVIHTVAGSNKELRVSGLPADYVITIGDLLAFDYGSPERRALHRVLATVTADSAGLTPLFEVRPHIRPGTVAGDVVLLSKPAAKVKIIPGTFSPEMASTTTKRFRFTARQTLASD